MKDIGLVGVALFIVAGFLLTAIQVTLSALVHGDVLRLLAVPIGAVATWWIAAGSLRRTSWWRGRP